MQTTWTSIDTDKTRLATRTLTSLIDPRGTHEYRVLGCFARGDIVAVVYTDFAAHGAFAVDIADALNADEYVGQHDGYSHWCSATTDLADEDLARLVGDLYPESAVLRYGGTCSPVLADEVEDLVDSAARVCAQGWVEQTMQGMARRWTAPVPGADLDYLEREVLGRPATDEESAEFSRRFIDEFNARMQEKAEREGWDAATT